MTPEETAWQVANRLACTTGIFDNLVTQKREIWQDGVLRKAFTALHGFFHHWGSYPDHPFNTKAES